MVEMRRNKRQKCSLEIWVKILNNQYLFIIRLFHRNEQIWLCVLAEIRHLAQFH